MRCRAVAVLVGLLLSGSLAAASPQADEAVRRGTSWLVSRQQPDGAFFTAGQSPDMTAEALAAVVAGGGSAAAVDHALRYLRDAGPERAEAKPAYAGRIAAGIVAAGGDPSDFGGYDYTARLRRAYNPTTGAYDSNLYANALATLGVVAAEGGLPERAVTYLRTNQCADGGYAWREGCLAPADVDTTAVVTSVLLAAGVPPEDTAVSRARMFVQRSQDPSGGFGLEPGMPVNANSTGLALSLIAALGEDPTAAPWQREDGHPVGALAALQTAEGGFRYTAGDDSPNNYAAVQAVPGLAARPLPIAPVPRRSRATPVPAREPGPSGSTPRPDRRSAPDETGPAADRPEEGNRAGLVVRSEDGELRRICLLFDEPEITGAELLTRSGLDLEVETTPTGTAVCRIGSDGCGAGDCFCGYPTFWGYWTRDGGSWAFSEVGASQRRVVDGSLDGWVWGPDGGPAPPEESLDEVCAAAPEAGAAERAPAGDSGRAAEGSEPASGFVPFLGAAGVLAVAGTLLAVRRRKEQR